MNKLTVLYDPSCGFCVRCRAWLGAQPAFVPLDFVAVGSRAASLLFPDLAARDGELTVVRDDGAVWRGTDAYLTCLWALVEYRELGLRLALPLLKPFARAAFGALSGSRRTLSWLLRLEPEDLAAELSGDPPPPSAASLP